MKHFFFIPFIAILFSSCQKDNCTEPEALKIIGRWQSMIPANPHWYYDFHEDGTMCQKLNQWGADSEDCFYHWHVYGKNQDTLLISADGKVRTWVLQYDGTTVLKVTNITDGAILAPVFYLHR